MRFGYLSLLAAMASSAAAQYIHPCADSCLWLGRGQCMLHLFWRRSCLIKKLGERLDHMCHYNEALFSLQLCVWDMCQDEGAVSDTYSYVLDICHAEGDSHRRAQTAYKHLDARNAAGAGVQPVARQVGGVSFTPNRTPTPTPTPTPLPTPNTSSSRSFVPISGPTSSFRPLSTSTPSAIPPFNSSITDTSGGGLSTGAKVGLGVGVPVAVLAIFGGIVFMLWRRRRANRPSPFPEMEYAATADAGRGTGVAELEAARRYPVGHGQFERR